MFDVRTVPTYVINLDHQTQKWNDFQNGFVPLGFSPQRFPAVYGKDFAIEDLIRQGTVDASVLYTMQNGRYHHANISTMGAIGCYLSHVRLWEQLVNDPNQPEMYLIVEDDCGAPTEEVLEQANQYVQDVINLFERWDVIYLGALDWLAVNRTSEGYAVTDRIVYVNDMVYGTHAYLLHREGAKKLLAHAFPIVWQVDSYMSYQYITGEVKAFRPRTSFFSQMGSYGSSIQVSDGMNLRPLLTNLSMTTVWSAIVVGLVCVLFTLSVILLYVIRRSRQH